MNVSINQLVKSLLQKDSLEHCSLPELTAYAERNPYFGAAQLLLAKKLQTDSPEKFEEQYQKTLLYFHNPLWVEHLLNDTGQGEVQKEAAEVEQPDLLTSLQVEKAVEVVEGKGSEVGEAEKKEETTVVDNMDDLQIEKEIVAEEVKMEELDSIATSVTVDTHVAENNTEPVVPAPVEVQGQGNDLLFEPFHTVDYFASQGIKFREEERPTDEFGKQLKSFTDWLKTFKRLPATELAKAVTPQSEQKVEQLAGQSITDREVVTEAMAEVWEKQGNALKAINIYSKLSLLEPAKSAYFAAKIEELKKKN